MKLHTPSFPRVLASLVCVAAAVAGGCRKAPPPPKPPSTLPVNSFMRVWQTQVDIKKDALAELHVRDDMVYAVTGKGRVSGLKRDAGLLQFTYDIKGGGGDTLRPPVVLKDHVAFPTATTLEVYMRDGRFARSIALPFAVRSNADGFGTFVFLAGDYPLGGARVAKVDVTKDYVPVVWDFMGHDAGRSGFRSGLKVVEDGVYAGGMDGNVYAVVAGSRESIWPIPRGVFDTGGAIEANLAADTSGVYVASTDGVLYALNRNSGKLRWQYFAGTPLREGALVMSDRVYLKVPGKGTLSFAKNEGKEVREPLWTRTDLRQVLAQDDKYTYALGTDGRLVALDKTTGEPKFHSKRKDLKVFGVNTKDDGTIFAATKAGQVLAIRGVFKPGVIGEQVMNDDADWEPVALAAR